MYILTEESYKKISKSFKLIESSHVIQAYFDIMYQTVETRIKLEKRDESWASTIATLNIKHHEHELVLSEHEFYLNSVEAKDFIKNKGEVFTEYHREIYEIDQENKFEIRIFKNGKDDKICCYFNEVSEDFSIDNYVDDYKTVDEKIMNEFNFAYEMDKDKVNEMLKYF